MTASSIRSGAFFALLFTTLALANGCQGRDRSTTREGRPAPSPTPTDSGVTSPAAEDGGTAEPPAPRGPEPGAPAGDAGRAEGSACPPFDWPAPEPSTRATCGRDLPPCLSGARTTADRSSCYAVQSEACSECIFGALYHCASASGCDREMGEVECCLEDACPSGEQVCIDDALDEAGACASADDAMIACIQARVDDESCAYLDNECIAPSGAL